MIVPAFLFPSADEAGSQDAAMPAGTAAAAGDESPWAPLAALLGQGETDLSGTPDADPSTAQAGSGVSANTLALLRGGEFYPLLSSALAAPLTAGEADTTAATDTAGTAGAAEALLAALGLVCSADTGAAADTPDDLAADTSTASTAAETPAAPAATGGTSTQPALPAVISTLFFETPEETETGATAPADAAETGETSLPLSRPLVTSAGAEQEEPALHPRESSAESPAASTAVDIAPIAPAFTVQAPPAVETAAAPTAPAPMEETAGTVSAVWTAAAETATALAESAAASLNASTSGQPAAAVAAEEAAPGTELAFAVRLRAAAADSGAGSVAADQDAATATVPKITAGNSRDSGGGNSAAAESETTQPETADDAARAGDTQVLTAAAKTAAAGTTAALTAVQPAEDPVSAAPQPAAATDTAASIARALASPAEAQSAEDGAAQPVRELAVRISDGTSRSADVRIMDRAGEIQISVRSADSGLSASLREGLSELSSRMEAHSVSAEIWQPAVSSTRSAGSQTQEQGADGGASRQGFQDGDSGGSSGGGQQSRQERQSAPEWLEEMESSSAIPYRRNTRT